MSNQSPLVLRADKLRAARGAVVATQVSVTAQPGEVVAVEGANGSGKSTLLAAAAGLLPAAHGTRRPPTIGYAPERADVLPRLSVRRWLVGLARTAGLSRADAARQVDELTSRLGLSDSQGTPLRALSQGNTERVVVAQALIGPPSLVVPDEPSGGLDADGVRRVPAEIARVATRSSALIHLLTSAISGLHFTGW